MTLSVSGSQITFADNSTQNTAATGFGFKNRIINGAMMIDQRNAGASVTVGGGNAVYTLDRWGFYSAGANQTAQQVSASSYGFQYGLQIIGGSGATAATLYYRIESKNIWDCASQQITLSFKVYNSESSKNLQVDLDYPNVADNFNAVTNFSSTVLSIPNGISTQTITVTANSNVINGLQVQFKFGAIAAANTRMLIGVQLEKGSTATSFDYRPYGTELSLCQRYFQALGGTSSNDALGNGFANGTTCYVIGWYVCPMRTAPTLGVIGTIGNLNVTGVGVSAALTNISNTGTGNTGFYINTTSASSITAGQGVNFRTVVSGTYLTASAEL